MVSRTTNDIDGYLEPKPYDPVLELENQQFTFRPGPTQTAAVQSQNMVLGCKISDFGRRGIVLSV